MGFGFVVGVGFASAGGFVQRRRVPRGNLGPSREALRMESSIGGVWRVESGAGGKGGCVGVGMWGSSGRGRKEILGAR